MQSFKKNPYYVVMASAHGSDKANLPRATCLGLEHAKEKMHAELDTMRTKLHQGRKELQEERQNSFALEDEL